MLDLIGFAFSLPGLAVILVALYVVDDVFGLGWKKKVRELVGRDNLFHDPEIDELRNELNTLRGMVEAHAKNGPAHNRAPDGCAPESSLSAAFAPKTTTPGSNPPTDAVNKGWTSWADRPEGEEG